jgi:PTH1 family peptidyl-tRNA hydrolase
MKINVRGHNGVISVVNILKSDNIRRLQFGINRPESRDPEAVANYVLSNFNKI